MLLKAYKHQPLPTMEKTAEEEQQQKEQIAENRINEIQKEIMKTH